MPAVFRCDSSGARKRARAPPERARVIWSRLQPRVDERPHEPGPNRSLMIGSIALSGVSAVTRLVFRVVRVQRSEPHGVNSRRSTRSTICALLVPLRSETEARPPPKSDWAEFSDPWYRRRGRHRLRRTEPPLLGLKNRLEKDASAVSAKAFHSGNRSPPIRSALIHNAWTSTGLPVRRATTKSPTFRSIQVSWISRLASTQQTIGVYRDAVACPC